MTGIRVTTSTRLRRPPARLRTPLVVAGSCLAVVLLRLSFVWHPLRPDEGGYLYTARRWDTEGEFLYGDYHVDRPPVLMLFFRLAATSDWDGLVRVLTIPVAVLTVLAVARAAALVGGARAARWAAVLTAAFLCTPAFAADQADGEMFAVPFVAVSLALALEAWRRPVGVAQLYWALAAGAAAVLAGAVKQSFVDGLVFLAVLAAADAARRSSRARARVLASGGAAGALLAMLVVLAWSRASGIELGQLWADVVVFRGDALVESWRDPDEPAIRAARLLLLALVTGMLPLVWLAGRHLRRPAPWELAAAITLAYDVVAIAAGGSYWMHYLLQPVPVIALLAGTLAAHAPEGVGARRWSVAAVVSTVVAAIGMSVAYATVPALWSHQRIGHWLTASSQPGDTAVVTYGSPSILEASDLDSPYPYLWSLPVRALDPETERLRELLSGPDAPTWVVQVGGLDVWGLDPGRRLWRLVNARYDVAAEVCGQPGVWLRSDLERDLAPPPDC